MSSQTRAAQPGNEVPPADQFHVSGDDSWRRRVRLSMMATDVVAIVIAVAMSFTLLFEPTDRVTGGELPYWAFSIIMILGWVAALAMGGAHSLRGLGAGLQEYRRVLAVSVQYFGVVAIAAFVLHQSVSRMVFLTTAPFGMALLFLGRWLLRKVVLHARGSTRLMTPTLVVGAAGQVEPLIADLVRRYDVGYLPVRVCVIDGAPCQLPPGIERVELPDLQTAADDPAIGALIVTDGLPREQVRELAWSLEQRPVQLLFLPRLVDMAGPRMTVSDVEGLALVHVDLPRFSGWKLGLKRVFDVLFSLVVLVLVSPLLALIALFIKLDDGGPVFFRQKRVGLRGRVFTIHKFRTMVTDAEELAADLIEEHGGQVLLFKLEDDPRITRIGKVLRRHSLDELPQFWTVLRGSMSVVGPRPPLIREVAEYTEMHQRRLLIRPGITGLWQVNGRSDLSWEESIRLDLRYVENWSLFEDLVIILKTVRVMLRPRGAY